MLASLRELERELVFQQSVSQISRQLDFSN